MSELVRIEWKFPNLKMAVEKREMEIYMLIAASMQTNRGMMFDNSNAGRTPWEKPKLRDGQPLSQKGALRQSFGPTNDGKRPAKNPGGIVKFNAGVVTIGTDLKYASILNTGGIIRPKRFPVLWIPLPDGAAKSSNAPSKLTKQLKKEFKAGTGTAPIVKGRNGKFYLLAKKATIPARPMDEWNQEDQIEMEETLRNKLEEILNGAN
jgi:phage gpG-like protein